MHIHIYLYIMYVCTIFLKIFYKKIKSSYSKVINNSKTFLFCLFSKQMTDQ